MDALDRCSENRMGICGDSILFKQLAICIEAGADLCVAPMGADA